MPASDFAWYLQRLASFGDREAMLSTAQVVSYRDLVEQSREMSSRLRLEGIEAGAKVAISGDFTVGNTAAVLALAQLAAVIIPFSEDSSVETSTCIDVSGCDFKLSVSSAGEVDVRPYHVARTHRHFATLKECGHPGLVLFSSGTTGEPKGIVHDLCRIVERFRNQGRTFRAVPMLMFDHFGGHNTLLGLMSSGSAIISIEKRTVDSVCSAIETFGVDLLPATPSFLALMLALNGPARYDLSSLRRITYGTELMPEALLRRVSAAFPGVTLQQTYGLSETGVLSTKSESSESTWVKVGGLGYDTKVVDGTLWVRSDFSMLGYLSQVEESDEADGWFNTRDRVEVKGDFLKFLGRDSDLINVGGQKVMPGEVESCLLEIPQILSARVYGRPHALLGQTVHADVVQGNDTDPVDKRFIRRHCRERLASFKVPQTVNFVDSIVLTPRLKKGASGDA